MVRKTVTLKAMQGTMIISSWVSIDSKMIIEAEISISGHRANISFVPDNTWNYNFTFIADLMEYRIYDENWDLFISITEVS